MENNEKIEWIADSALKVTRARGRLLDTTYYAVPQNSALHSMELKKLSLLKGTLTSEFLKSHGAYLQNLKKDGLIIPASEMVVRDSGLTYTRRYFDKGQLHDPSNGEAADILYREGTTMLHARTHYQNGLIHNPAPDVAAIMTFDGKTGLTRITSFYEFDKPNDPAENYPSYEEVWTETRHLVARQFRKAGILNDPASGDAAWQRYSNETGDLVEKVHYKNGFNLR